MKKINFYALVVTAAAVICAVYIFHSAVSLLEERALDRVISSELSESRISSRDLVGKVKRVYTEKRYWVAESFSFDDFESRFQRALEKSGYKLLSSSRTMKESTIGGKKEARQEASFIISEPSSTVPVYRLTLIKRAVPKALRPKLALVLDDWGYNTKNLENVLKIDAPMTLSILPELPYSATVADKASEHGFEVILHMPMEPKAKMKLELSTLYTTMSDDEIRATLDRCLRSVPHAVGISNHEGSKATEDMRLMTTVLTELKKRDMFFLDSVVTNDSTAEYLAKKIGIKFAKRAIFLDNESSPDYIKSQLDKAVTLALKTGAAVAIGHDRPNTVAVLREMVPRIKEKGIEMTGVSGLAR